VLDLTEARERAARWLGPLMQGARGLARSVALGEENMALDVLDLADEIEKLRAALEEACAIAENDHKFMRLDARPLDADEAILLSLYERRIAALRRLVQP
jgi:uncharacterized ferredoxin-like protein